MKTVSTIAVRTSLTALLAAAALTAQVQAADNLFVLESQAGSNKVHAFGPTGADLGTYVDATAAGLIAPIGIAFDGSGNLYVGDYAWPGSTIHKFGPNGVDLGVFTSSVNGTEGIAFDKSGNLYAANNNDNNVRKFSPAGTNLGAFASVSTPLGIAFDQSGNLFVANSFSIHKFGPNGADLGAFATGLTQCYNVAVDHSGNVYAALHQGGEVLKYTASGVSLGAFAFVNLPYGMAFDANDNLYVTDTLSNTIREFGPTGTDLGIFASTGSNFPGYLAFAPLAVPEPSSATLLFIGGALVVLLSLRR